MGMGLARAGFLVVGVLLLALGGCGGGDRVDAPRVLITVVVDGLSTRQMLRHQECFDQGGFRRLLDEGAWFERARFSHSTTFTAPGHATIATGATPAEHGLVGNGWFDRETGRRVYCMSDPEVRSVGAARSRPSSSPRNLEVPTLADVLWMRSEGRSRSLAVSVKDRAATVGSGRHGQAYWWDNGSGRFVTSSFYFDAMPPWWEDYYETSPQNVHIGREKIDRPCDLPWHSLYRVALDSLRAHGVRARIHDRLPENATKTYFRALKSSPWVDELTFDFLREALAHSEVGRDPDRIDHLFVSFSAHDYVSHNVGPDSPTATSVLRHLDAILAGLFDELDAVVGRGEWTLAFTADHGYPETPESEELRGIDAGRLDPRRLGADLDRYLDTTFAEHDWIEHWSVPTFYLDIPRDFDEREVWRVAQGWLEVQRGIQAVFRRDQLVAETPADSLLTAARHSYSPRRSGDLLVVQRPNWYLLGDPLADVCTHGSPHPYDREVPLIFLGRGVRTGHYRDPAEIRDLAPTLLALAGETPASTMSGKVLGAALRGSRFRSADGASASR